MKNFFYGAVFTVIVLSFISGTANAQASPAGLEPGAHVKIIKKDGKTFDGSLVKVTTIEYQINTTQNLRVKKYLRDIKKITDTGKSDTGGGISYRPVHEYTTLNDQTFQGIYFGSSGIAFDIDLGVLGIQKGISIESLQSIEVIPYGTAVASEQECMVTCPHCGKPIRIKVSK